jgi:cbb3-type cytochrome oxidase subunit 3
MRWMVSDFFARSPVLLGPVIALVLFMIVFTATAIYALRTHREQNDRMARMPLKEDERHE